MRYDEHRAIQAVKIAACVVIVAWGIRTASHVLSIVLLSLLLTYAILPFPMWLTRRFRFPKSVALGCTVLLLIAFYCVLTFALVKTGFQMSARLPIYEQRIENLHVQIAGFLSRNGIESTDLSVKSFLSSGRLIQFTSEILPSTIELFSDRLLIWFLTLLFLIEFLESDGGGSRIARRLANFGRDTQRFIATTAETGAIIALANLLLLSVLGVDFAVIWCLLYFFLHFIPSIGFMIALVPPTLLALLMFGWKRGLLVLGGLILTEMLGENVLKPALLKKGLDIGLIEITLSLVGWGFLLGPAGAVLSVPLTLALRRVIDRATTSEAVTS
ncbi:MAG: AI-2E family transporter [Candidatus Acidiferrum sp.]